MTEAYSSEYSTVHFTVSPAVAWPGRMGPSTTYGTQPIRVTYSSGLRRLGQGKLPSSNKSGVAFAHGWLNWYTGETN